MKLAKKKLKSCMNTQKIGKTYTKAKQIHYESDSNKN
jgi:hypothetical protein